MTWVTLSETSQLRVMQALGYPFQGFPEVVSMLNNFMPELYADKIDELLDELDELDTQLKQAYLDSMATKLDDLTVDFVRQVWLLRKRGAELLLLVSQYSTIPINVNRFAAGRSQRSILDYV